MREIVKTDEIGFGESNFSYTDAPRSKHVASTLLGLARTQVITCRSYFAWYMKSHTKAHASCMAFGRALRIKTWVSTQTEVKQQIMLNHVWRLRLHILSAPTASSLRSVIDDALSSYAPLACRAYTTTSPHWLLVAHVDVRPVLRTLGRLPPAYLKTWNF